MEYFKTLPRDLSNYFEKFYDWQVFAPELHVYTKMTYELNIEKRLGIEAYREAQICGDAHCLLIMSYVPQALHTLL